MTVEITIADGKNSLNLNDGIIESIWHPGSVVDVDDARASILAVQRLSGGIPMPLLVERTDVQVSAAARRAYDARSVAAVALVGSSVVDRVVAAAMHRHAFCPHKFFTSRQDAVAWLKRITTGPGPQSADGLDDRPAC